MTREFFEVGFQPSRNFDPGGKGGMSGRAPIELSGWEIFKGAEVEKRGCGDGGMVRVRSMGGKGSARLGVRGFPVSLNQRMGT